MLLDEEIPEGGRHDPAAPGRRRPASRQRANLFPVDFLKIDRSFVTSMQTVAKQGRIVETILLLARNLGVGVIAEGVEEEGQRVALQALGCVLGQGYLFSKPVDAAGVRGLLTKGIAPAV